MADVVIVSGSPGCGKSTVAQRVAEGEPTSVHLRGDDFWHVIVSGGVAPFLPEADAQNHTVMRALSAAAFAYAEGGFTTVVDGVIGPWMLHHFVQRAVAEPSARLHYVVLRPSLATALRRAQARTGPDDLVDSGPITVLWEQFASIGRGEPHVWDSTEESVEESVAGVRRLIASGAALVEPEAWLPTSSPPRQD